MTGDERPPMTRAEARARGLTGATRPAPPTPDDSTPDAAREPAAKAEPAPESEPAEGSETAPESEPTQESELAWPTPRVERAGPAGRRRRTEPAEATERAGRATSGLATARSRPLIPRPGVRPSRRRAGRVTIRPYRRSDDAGLAAVCLATADDGADGTALYRHPELPGAVYAVPYVRFEPDLCLVLDDGTPEGRVSGYVLGTSDTVAYEQWCERAWWPGLRRRFPLTAQPEGSADRRLASMAEDPETTPTSVTDRYPAHLHVDLLPHVQGQGWGRRLLERFMVEAAGAGATGVHLGVAETNTRAIGFYGRLGFHLVQPVPGALLMGRPLP